jgi:RNA polymerase sigma-70 factor (ECF subfamily)
MTPNDSELYASWVSTHAPGLFRFACRLTGSRDHADDLLQETFTEAWKSRHLLSDPAKARAWLFQILRHRWMHHLRDSSRRLRPLTGPAAQAAMADQPSPSDNPAHNLAESDALQRALMILENDMRLPLLLVTMEGHTCQEVADMLGLPLGTVLSRIHRAKAALRDYLERHHETPRPAGGAK